MQEKSHIFGVRRVMSKLLRSPQFSHGCRVWSVHLPRVLQGDSDALSYARPHSLCSTGAGSLLMSQVLAKVVALPHGGLRGLQEKVRAHGNW